MAERAPVQIPFRSVEDRLKEDDAPLILHEIMNELPVSWLTWHEHHSPQGATAKVFYLVSDGRCIGCP